MGKVRTFEKASGDWAPVSSAAHSPRWAGLLELHLGQNADVLQVGGAYKRLVEMRASFSAHLGLRVMRRPDRSEQLWVDESGKGTSRGQRPRPIFQLNASGCPVIDLSTFSKKFSAISLRSVS